MNRSRTDNTMIKTKEGQSIQWAKQKKDRQYIGQNKRRTDNTMGKTKEEQTMQWPKEKDQKDKQWSTKHYTEDIRRTDNTMAKQIIEDGQTIQWPNK